MVQKAGSSGSTSSMRVASHCFHRKHSLPLIQPQSYLAVSCRSWQCVPVWIWLSQKSFSMSVTLVFPRKVPIIYGVAIQLDILMITITIMKWTFLLYWVQNCSSRSVLPLTHHTPHSPQQDAILSGRWITLISRAHCLMWQVENVPPHTAAHATEKAPDV